MRRAARIVAVAEALRRETLDTFRLRPERIVVIPKGIDPDRIRPERGRDATRRAFGIESDTPVILSLGALTWEKDVVGHIEILATVRRHIPEARHLIVGDGPERPLVERAVREHGLTDAAFILGARLDVGDLLAASDVLLLASRSEGMPGCLIEAGMVGLPVAGYAMGGVGEVVVDGETGRLTALGRREDLAAAVVDLLADEALRRSLGAAAKERCLRLFSMETVARSYVDLYEDLTRPA
jgi:glycosyltransferase involved in cell wall biosynthesis